MRRLWSRYLRVGVLCGLAVGSVGLTGLVASAGVAAADAPLPPTPAPPVVIPGSPVAVTQLAGTNVFATAAKIGQRSFPHGAPTAVVVSAAPGDLSDALAGSYLAGEQDNDKGAPILLVNPTSVPSQTSAVLKTLGITHIVIVGGTSAVSPAVATELTGGGKVTVSRVGGANRFVTADEADTTTGSSAAHNVGTAGAREYAVVADGQDQDLVDALGAAPVLGAGPFPLFLVNGPSGKLSSTDLSIIDNEDITGIVILGGTAAVGTQVVSQLKALNINASSFREAGPNRSATSVALANFAIKTFGFSTSHFNIASGAQASLLNSLLGGALGALQRAPTLITASATDPGSVVSFATTRASTETTANLFGGFGTVSALAVAAIAAPTSPPGTSSPVPGTAAAESAAITLLTKPSVPPGSVPVASPPVATPPSTTLDQPAERPVCSPLVDDASYWTVPNTTASAVSTYIQTHLTPGTTTNGIGSIGGPVIEYDVTEKPNIQVGQGSSLLFSIAPLGNASVGIRADAQVIPSGASCASGLSAGGLSSTPAG